jgi:carboxyl-terminal processing protease
VQKPFDLADRSMLKLTIAKWFTPNNVNIDKEGINPDIEVKFKKEDYTPEE